jgi:hypothetical protein
MKRMEWDDQMRSLKTIDQVHIHAGEMKRMERDNKMKGIQTIDQKFTYALETDEEEWIG